LFGANKKANKKSAIHCWGVTISMENHIRGYGQLAMARAAHDETHTHTNNKRRRLTDACNKSGSNDTDSQTPPVISAEAWYHVCEKIDNPTDLAALSEVCQASSVAARSEKLWKCIYARRFRCPLRADVEREAAGAGWKATFARRCRPMRIVVLHYDLSMLKFEGHVADLLNTFHRMFRDIACGDDAKRLRFCVASMMSAPPDKLAMWAAVQHATSAEEWRWVQLSGSTTTYIGDLTGSDFLLIYAATQYDLHRSDLRGPPSKISLEEESVRNAGAAALKAIDILSHLSAVETYGGASKRLRTTRKRLDPIEELISLPTCRDILPLVGRYLYAQPISMPFNDDALVGVTFLGTKRFRMGSFAEPVHVEMTDSELELVVHIHHGAVRDFLLRKDELNASTGAKCLVEWPSKRDAYVPLLDASDSFRIRLLWLAHKDFFVLAGERFGKKATAVRLSDMQARDMMARDRRARPAVVEVQDRGLLLRPSRYMNVLVATKIFFL
jgi:hypothetical protein